MIAVLPALVLSFAVFSWALPYAHAVTLDFDGAEYTATTAEKIKFGWEASLRKIGSVEEPCSDCEYEVRIYHVERKSYIEVGKITALAQEIKLPKTGHYVFEVRACRDEAAGSDPPRICSDWASSINEANSPKVGDETKKWRVYGRPAPAGDIVVGK